MKKTWSIGEGIFKENYRRRVRMFEALVESVAMFGTEIWGWKEEERIDAISRKYVKWILGLDRTTPNYILEEELKLKNMKINALKKLLNTKKQRKAQTNN